MRLGANEVAVLKNPGAMKGHRNSFDFILIVVRKTGDGGERMPKSDAGQRFSIDTRLLKGGA